MYRFLWRLWYWLMYFLCKSDLSPWAVSRDQIDRFSKENGFIGWTETSVKENRNINEAMRWVALSALGTGTQTVTLFSDSWANKYRLSHWNASVPKIIEDKGVLKPSVLLEFCLVIRQCRLHLLFLYLPSQAYFSCFLFLKESSLKRWWTIPEKI